MTASFFRSVSPVKERLRTAWMDWRTWRESICSRCLEKMAHHSHQPSNASIVGTYPQRSTKPVRKPSKAKQVQPTGPWRKPGACWLNLFRLFVLQCAAIAAAGDGTDNRDQDTCANDGEEQATPEAERGSEQESCKNPTNDRSEDTDNDV